MNQQANRFCLFGPFRLDAKRRLLWRDGQLVPLSPKAIETLIALVERRGALVEKEELMTRLWPNTFVEEGNLTFNIWVLRKALGDVRRNGNRYIETVPKRGYRFIAPVTETALGIEDSGPCETTATDAAGTGVAPGLGLNGVSVQPGHPPGVPLQASTAPQLETRVSNPASLSRFWLAVATVAVAVAVVGYVLIRPLPPPRFRASYRLTNDGRPKLGLVVSDGLRLYYAEGASDDRVLRSLSVSGAGTATISLSIQDWDLLDISPDHSLLLLGSMEGIEAPFWILPLPAGPLSRVGDLVGHGASWSLDGHKIVFGKGHDLYIASSDGGGPRRIATIRGTAEVPRWSPDGKVVRFTHLDPDKQRRTLWQVSVDGHDLHPLLPGWYGSANQCCGNWTPDGRYFVFESRTGEKQGESSIWAIREKGAGLQWAGREPVQLTDPAEQHYSLFRGLDGKRVYVVDRRVRGQLTRYDRTLKQFVPYLGGISAEWVNFTRDGEWAAYVNYPDGTLWLRKSDGPDRQLTFSPLNVDGGLSWSPDGKRIAFRASKPGRPYKIYLVSAEGGEPQALLPEHAEEEGIPTWSADGRTIAFGDVPAVFGHATERNVIHIVELSTHRLETLPNSNGLWTARWSPDGRYIAALKDNDPDPYAQRMLLFDWQSGEWRRLNANYVNNPTWSHDGRYIYYDGETRHEGIYHVRIGDGNVEQLVSMTDMDRPSMEWSGLTPDDSPLILRDVGIQEIYALDVEWP